MDESALIALAATAFGWAVLSGWFDRHDITGPMVFLVGGLVLANPSWGIVDVNLANSTVHDTAEITLALLLFADASTVSLTAARRDVPLTARLLGIGLPLSIVVGTVLAALVFPGLPFALTALIATCLAPTDAALSASVISDTRLPGRVRRVLNVESGLNDGIATPLVTLAIAASATSLGVVDKQFEDGFGALAELAIGVGVGVGIGLTAGRVIAGAHRRGWMQEGSRRFATLALPVATFLVASMLGGNPFVGAFAGGVSFGATASTDAAPSIELTELLAKLFSFALWFVFGASFVLPAFESLDLRTVIYATLSLTVVRMLPVAVSLLASGVDRSTTAFIGWFGPRGLASVVFALLAVDQLGSTNPHVVVATNTIAVTIVFSIMAHGFSGRPLATRYVTSRPGTEDEQGGERS